MAKPYLEGNVWSVRVRVQGQDTSKPIDPANAEEIGDCILFRRRADNKNC